MPVSEFMECWVYYRMEPFGDARADLQAGMIASTIVNVKMPRGAAPLLPDMFVPKIDWQKIAEPNKPMSVEEQIAQWNAITAAQNSKYVH